MEKKLVMEFGYIKVYKSKGFSENEYLVVHKVGDNKGRAVKCEIKVLFANYLGVTKIPYDVEIILKEEEKIDNYHPLDSSLFPFKELHSAFLFLQTKSVIFVND